jgi:hypothetical protein
MSSRPATGAGRQRNAADPARTPRIKTTVDAVTNSDSPAATSVANRYGTPKRAMSKRAKIIAIAVAFALGLTWILWSVVASNTGVDQKVISFKVVDPTLSTVDLTITKDPAATAQCAVQALNEQFAVVGWNILTVGANGVDAGINNGHTTSVTASVRTTSLAVTVVVDNCWIKH